MKSDGDGWDMNSNYMSLLFFFLLICLVVGLVIWCSREQDERPEHHSKHRGVHVYRLVSEV